MPEVIVLLVVTCLVELQLLLPLFLGLPTQILMLDHCNYKALLEKYIMS